MAEQSGEGSRALTRTVAADLGNCQFGVVVEDRLRNAAKECERRYVAIEKRLRRLGGIGLHERRIRMRQIHVEHVHLLTHPADHADRFSEIDLRVPRRMDERHERLAGSELPLVDVILHCRVAATVTMLGLQPLEDSLGRMALLRRCLLVCRQDRINHADERPQRWPLDWFDALVTGWC